MSKNQGDLEDFIFKYNIKDKSSLWKIGEVEVIEVLIKNRENMFEEAEAKFIKKFNLDKKIKNQDYKIISITYI